MELNKAFEGLGLENRRKEGQIVAIGFSDLRIICDNRKRGVTEAKQSEYDLFWKKHCVTHPNDRNDPILSLRKVSVVNGEDIELLCRTSAFADFCATRDYCRGRRLNIFNARGIDHDYPFPVSFGMVSRTLPTKDHPNGCVIAAIRGNTAFDANRATFLPGGYINPKVDRSLKQGLKLNPLSSAIRREFREELPGINYPQDPPRLLAIVHSLVESCQPAILGWMDIPCTVDGARKMYRQDNNHEIKEILYIPADIESLRAFAQEYTLCIHDVYKIALFVADTM